MAIIRVLVCADSPSDSSRSIMAINDAKSLSRITKRNSEAGSNK